MLRLTLFTRVAVLVAVALAAVWILSFSLYLRNQAELFLELGPTPERLLAMVHQFDRQPLDAHDGLILAISSERLSVEVLQPGARVPPADLRPAEPEVRARYAAVLGDRLLSVSETPLTGLASRFPRISKQRESGFAFQLALRSGSVLLVTVSNPFVFNRLGFPVGFGAGLFGTVVAFLALLLMQRETRPLRQLAAAVDTVDFSSDPVPLPQARNSAPEIRGVIAAFNRLQDRLHVVMKARMALIGGISHDVRTFAARLRLRIDGIENEAERQRAEADIRDMIRLLDDALLSSRAGAGELSEELVEFGALVASEIEDRRRQSARADLVIEPGAHEAQVLGDRLALRRVIANLSDNALNYGKIAHLRLSIGPGTVVLMVDDEGPGIPPELRQMMLEPFSRLEQSRNRSTGGAGLGLAIVRTLVAAHRGTLRISDAPGGGARFIVTLPLFRP